MSNEDLCKEIQSGNREKLAELWEQTQRLIRREARKRRERPSTAFEDYMQAGFLAVAAAAETYCPDNGAKFTTWLGQYLLTAFSEAAGRRSDKQKLDPIHTAASLDKPLQDDEDATMLELISDPHDAIEELDGQIYQEQLRAEIERVLATIEDADLLRQRYFAELPIREIAEAAAVPEQEIRRRSDAAVRAFRRSITRPEGRELKRFLEDSTDYFRPVGVAAFIRENESSVEKAVFQREQLTRDYYRNQGRE